MKPLAGIRCLTIEQFAAGPYGSMFLADLGAEVIKIENPATGGDPARNGPFAGLGENDSLYFQGWNTNKRSIELDIKSTDGRKIFERLVQNADAVINNLRGDHPSRLKLDYKGLSELNPAICCLHISAYGRDNERAGRPGYDFLMQAEAGLMSLTGEPNGPPTRFGSSIIDYMSGITGALGLVACIMRARQTGIGCDVDVSLFDVALHQLNYSATWYLNQGLVSERQPRSAHSGNSPVQLFKAADGWIFLMCMSEKFWSLLTQEFAHLDLNLDPRFVDNAARLANRAALTEILDREFQKHGMQEWIDRLGTSIPIGPVYDIAQALESEFVRTSNLIGPVPHPARLDLQLLANPIKINSKRLSQAVCSALGQDNATYLGDATHVAASSAMQEIEKGGRQ